MRPELRILGRIAVIQGGDDVDIGGHRQRAVLAALLADAGRVVLADQIIERVWGIGAPDQALVSLRSYISRLRPVLDGIVDISAHSGGRPGYRLDVTGATVDVDAFRAGCERAGREPDPLAGIRAYESAFELWPSGALPLHAMDTPWAESRRQALLEERHGARMDYLGLLIESGHHARALPELLELSQERPLDECVAELVVRALRAAGRRADALRHYEATRRLLAEELGADPAPELQRLHLRLLEGVPDPAWPDAAESDAAGPTWARAVRADSMPAGPHTFVGREQELAALDAAVAARDGGIIVISGPGGMGKSALALHWARTRARHFADGCLYLSLDGYHGAHPPLTHAKALRALAEMLGTYPTGMPGEPLALAAHVRSLLAGRNVLLIIDDARDATQIAHLLLGGFPGTVLVTSRNRLSTLVIDHDAHQVDVGPLETAAAVTLLRSRLRRAPEGRLPGEELVDDEAARAIARACGGLPLAITAAAARISSSPFAAWPRAVSKLAEELSADTVTDGSGSTALPAVKSALSSSYRVLDGQTAGALRLLSWYPGTDVTVRGAASLLGTPVASAVGLLDQLVEQNLLGEVHPGRFAMHGLVQGFARELSTGEESETATLRILHHYTLTAVEACREFGIDFLPPALPDPVPGVMRAEIPDRRTAVAWLGSERRALAHVIRLARTPAAYSAAWRLAVAVAEFQDYEAYWREMRAGLLLGLECARRSGEDLGLAHVHLRLARVGLQNGDLDYSCGALQCAIALFAQVGDAVGLAHAHGNLGWVLARRGERDEALEHTMEALALEMGAQNGNSAAALARMLGALVAVGRIDRAIVYGRLALIESRRTHDLANEVLALGGLAWAHERSGDWERSIDESLLEVELAERLGKTRLTLTPLIRIERLARRDGRRAEADAAREHAVRQAAALCMRPESRLPDGTALPSWLFEGRPEDLACAESALAELA